jgi:hypothetical protein
MPIGLEPPFDTFEAHALGEELFLDFHGPYFERITLKSIPLSIGHPDQSGQARDHEATWPEGIRVAFPISGATRVQPPYHCVDAIDAVDSFARKNVTR